MRYQSPKWHLSRRKTTWEGADEMTCLWAHIEVWGFWVQTVWSEKLLPCLLLIRVFEWGWLDFPRKYCGRGTLVGRMARARDGFDSRGAMTRILVWLLICTVIWRCGGVDDWDGRGEDDWEQFYIGVSSRSESLWFILVLDISAFE